MNEISHIPADFSFKQLVRIDANWFTEVGLENSRASRLGGTPEKGNTHKFLTRSIWLNNNKLKSIKNLDMMVKAVLEYPDQLGWIDFSFNFISHIDEVILKFPSLKIVYFHGNCIHDLDEIYKLKPLKELRTVTFHGNPVANHPRYRDFVIAALPQVQNLDFTPIVKTEKVRPAPPDVLKKLAKLEKPS